MEKEKRKSVKSKKQEDREFQLEMLRIQLGSDVFASIITVFMSIMVALITALITIGIGFNGVIPSTSLPCVIGVIIGSTILVAIVSWALFVKIRDAKIEKLRNNFIKSKANDNEQ